MLGADEMIDDVRPRGTLAPVTKPLLAVWMGALHDARGLRNSAVSTFVVDGWLLVVHGVAPEFPRVGGWSDVTQPKFSTCTFV